MEYDRKQYYENLRNKYFKGKRYSKNFKPFTNEEILDVCGLHVENSHNWAKMKVTGRGGEEYYIENVDSDFIVFKSKTKGDEIYFFDYGKVLFSITDNISVKLIEKTNANGSRTYKYTFVVLGDNHFTHESEFELSCTLYNPGNIHNIAEMALKIDGDHRYSAEIQQNLDIARVIDGSQYKNEGNWKKEIPLENINTKTINSVFDGVIKDKIEKSEGSEYKTDIMATIAFVRYCINYLSEQYVTHLFFSRKKVDEKLKEEKGKEIAEYVKQMEELKEKIAKLDNEYLDLVNKFNTFELPEENHRIR